MIEWRSVWTGGLGTLMAAVGWTAATLAQSLPPDGIIVPELAAEARTGQALYAEHCQSCHGVNGAGSDKGPTFLHRVYHRGHHGDGAFYLAVKRGARQHHWRFGDMRPVPGVSEDDVTKIIAYVRALQEANGIH